MKKVFSNKGLLKELVAPGWNNNPPKMNMELRELGCEGGWK
jgi:hypothetical protein